jgi:hypothetical protein
MRRGCCPLERLVGLRGTIYVQLVLCSANCINGRTMFGEDLRRLVARALWKLLGLGARCPYCRSTIYLWERPFLCERSMTAHHPTCWKETDQCAIFGCGSKQYYIRLADQPRPDQYPWWWG